MPVSADAPSMRIALFGPMAARLGTDHLDSAPLADTGAVLAWIAARHPELADLCRRSRVAVGDAFADGPIPPGTAEVAVIPPVSGG
jgi:molybdopterin converting factor small subunit